MVGATRLHTFLCRQDNRFRQLSVKQGRKGAHEALWHVYERAVKRFQVDKLLPDTRFLGQSQEFEKRFGK